MAARNRNGVHGVISSQLLGYSIDGERNVDMAGGLPKKITP